MIAADPSPRKAKRRHAPHANAIIRMALAGNSAREIRSRLGEQIPLSTVYQIMRDLRQTGDIPRRPPAEVGLKLCLTPDAYERLAIAAEDRDMRPGRLAGLLMRRMLDDDLISAVLDDEQ